VWVSLRWCHYDDVCYKHCIQRCCIESMPQGTAFCYSFSCCESGTIQYLHMHRMHCTALLWRHSLKRQYATSAVNSFGMWDCAHASSINAFIRLICRFSVPVVCCSVVQECMLWFCEKFNVFFIHSWPVPVT